MVFSQPNKIIMPFENLCPASSPKIYFHFCSKPINNHEGDDGDEGDDDDGDDSDDEDVDLITITIMILMIPGHPKVQ